MRFNATSERARPADHGPQERSRTAYVIILLIFRLRHFHLLSQVVTTHKFSDTLWFLALYLNSLEAPARRHATDNPGGLLLALPSRWVEIPSRRVALASCTPFIGYIPVGSELGGPSRSKERLSVSPAQSICIKGSLRSRCSRCVRSKGRSQPVAQYPGSKGVR